MRYTDVDGRLSAVVVSWIFVFVSARVMSSFQLAVFFISCWHVGTVLVNWLLFFGGCLIGAPIVPFPDVLMD